MTLILTLKLEPRLQDFFNKQRARYFPKQLNYLPAHISVFHQLPEVHYCIIDKALQALVDNNVALSMSIVGIQFLGQGNAYKIQLDNSLCLQLQKQWWDWLIPQDKQPWRPHITIQNKVSTIKAKDLYYKLQESWVNQTGFIIGFSLWRYLNGPWLPLKDYLFKK